MFSSKRTQVGVPSNIIDRESVGNLLVMAQISPDFVFKFGSPGFFQAGKGGIDERLDELESFVN